MTIQQYSCNRCQHSWWPRLFNPDGSPSHPERCPRCKSPYWDKKKLTPAQKKVAIKMGMAAAKARLVRDGIA